MAEAPLILGFDTSGPYCSAMLLRGEVIQADAYEDMAKGQAEHVFPLLESVLKEGGAAWRDLDALGVGIGPGNFTGIRISVSAARGLALSLDIPAVGVSLLEAAAFGCDGPVLSCRSAPRNSAYFQGFGTRTDIPAQFLAIDDVPADWAEPGLTCIGSAADAVAAKLGARVKPAAYAPGAAVARLAAQRWRNSPERPAPLYLKAADAAPPRDPAPVILS